MNHVDINKEPQRIISFCTGIQGLERGLRSAGMSIQPVCFVEIESFINENLVSGMEQGLVDEAPIWSNVKSFDGLPFRGMVHGFTGGYPCQPFSLAGQRKGTEDPRHLWPHIERHIGTVGPIWCFFENVAGHLTLGFPEVRESLSNLGYKVEAGIFTAEEVGAPHKRERLFILAIKRGYKLAYADSATNRHDTGGFQQEVARSGEKLANANSFRHPYGEPEIEPTNGGKYAQCDIATGVEDELEYTNDRRGEQCIQKFGCIPELNKRCTKLGNSQHNGQSTKSELRSSDENGEWSTQEQGTPIEFKGTDRPDNDESLPGCKMADTDNSGGKQNRQPGELRASGIIEPSINSRYSHPGENEQGQWPSGPGRPQHDWEAPRTVGFTDRLPRSIRKLWRDLRPHFAKALGEKVWQETDRNIKAAVEPILGVTINGYNFREDLLRAAGNSVVEPTASLAFLTLLEKHKK